jgi:GTP cyclohydrolase II
LPKSNLEKINAVRESGIEIVERMSADVPASAYSADYLAIKQDHLS